MYIFECIVCGKRIKSESAVAFHCGRLTQWVSGIGRGRLEVPEKKSRPKLFEERREEAIEEETDDNDMVKIRLSGYALISRDNLNEILRYDDPHAGIVLGIGAGFVNMANAEFDIEE